MQTAREILDNAVTFGINPSLESAREVCALLGSPADSFASIQVAGTNGKSSTSRYLAALLRAAGHKVGLYTSPELIDFTERIEVDGVTISEEAFEAALLKVYGTATDNDIELTEFELITLAALWHFSHTQCDYVVLEVGLGGKWDATSVVHPVLAILTGVDLDHTAILGNTIAEIAAEKVAVVKEGTIALVAPTKPEAFEVFKQHAKLQNAPFIEVPQAEAEQGSYQAQNKLTAASAARLLTSQNVSSYTSPWHNRVKGTYNVTHEVADQPSDMNDDFAVHVVTETDGSVSRPAEQAVEDTYLARIESVLSDALTADEQHTMDTLVIPGRLEKLHDDPVLIIDAAHNPASAGLLAQTLPEMDEPILLLGVLADKDAEGIITALAPKFSTIVVTQTTSPRAIEAEELAKLVTKLTGRTPQAFPSPKDALDALLQQTHPIIATGSITLAGAVKHALLDQQA